MAAAVTLLDMTAEGGGAAPFDGRHYAALRRGEGGPGWARKVSPQWRKTSATVSAARGTAVAQAMSGAGSGTGCGRRSSGLAAEQTLEVATRR